MCVLGNGCAMQRVCNMWRVCAKGWVCKGVHVWGGGRAMLRVWQAVGVRRVCKGGCARPGACHGVVCSTVSVQGRCARVCVCKAVGVQCDGGVIDGCACVRPWVCNALSVQGWECAMQWVCNGCAKVGR